MELYQQNEKQNHLTNPELYIVSSTCYIGYLGDEDVNLEGVWKFKYLLTGMLRTIIYHSFL